VDAFLRQILDQPAWLIYLITFLVVFAEDALFVGFVFPGETVAILGGVSAYLGHTEIGWMLAGVILMAIIGDSVGFEIGKAHGDRILAHRLLARRRAQIDQAQRFLRERGGSAVLLGRWTAFFRAVMPALAGWSGMPYRVFLPWNAVGGIAWASAVVLGGYFAGLSYERVAAWLGGGAAAVVAVIVVVAVAVWHLRRRRSERVEEAAARLASPATRGVAADTAEQA
jgi:membrane-associated protein